jgi:hypothetical protein
VKRPDFEEQKIREAHAAAEAKVRIWQERAEKARMAGRHADAQRCDDKIRDWASKAKQIERARRV